MKFGSVCSGIEAASVAWHPLGWEAAWLSEIEPFPCALLAHHYPSVPNLGNMTSLPDRIRSGEVEAPDLFCGGTPCQAFSVAGLRHSLDDARGNLSLTFCEIADAIDSVRTIPSIVFWENVPGVLNTKDNAFGCFLGALAGEDDALIPPGGRWANAGFVDGAKRAVAWRILDAQYFGVAQRRRRVFVVASARVDFDPAEVLFEFDGVRRDFAPSREAREVAPTIPARSLGGGGLGTDFDLDGGVITMAHGQGGAEIGFDRGPTLTCNHEAPIAAYSIMPMNSGKDYKARETDIAQPIMAGGPVGGNQGGDYIVQGVTHSLTTQCWNTTEDGTGRGAPLVPVAFSSKDYGGDAMHDLSPTLRAGGHSGSHANAGVPPAVTVAFNARQDPDSWAERTGPLDTDGGTQAVAFALQHAQIGRKDSAGPQGKGWQEGLAFTQDSRSCADAVATAMQVRRLTPRECERLQGFPDGYTDIKPKGKPTPDGPRYKALGNSWAVPVVRWIGKRIANELA
jgi:DNA (cytosine-5)-methyltransferase 1